MNRIEDKRKAILWARELVAMNPRDWCILDTETTALRSAEILQLGILWGNGQVALDVLLEPDFDFIGGTIPADSTAIHGITDAMVRDCPTLSQVMPVLDQIVSGKRVIIYNRAYDFGVLHGCIDRREGYDSDNYADVFMAQSLYECAMLPYSAYIGEPGRFGNDYKWQRLPNVGGGPAHSAIGDCRSTLAIIQSMAMTRLPGEVAATASGEAA